MTGPRFYEEPPQAIIHLYEQRGDGCWYWTNPSIVMSVEADRCDAWESEQRANCLHIAADREKGLPENPKYVQALKDGKAPLDRIPLGPLAAVARVMHGGGQKYGIRNFLLDKIRASTYVGAILRHLIEWALGSNKDKESGEHPLAHVISCCLIVMDSEAHGTLIDDRLIQESINPETGERRTHNPSNDNEDQK